MSMNAKIGIIVGVIVVIILGVGGFMLFQNANKAMTPGTPQNNTGSVKDLLTGAGNMECNYKDEDGRETHAYIKNGKVRAEIVSTNSSENGSVIFADDTIYIWNAQGAFKMQIPDETMNQDLSQNQAFSQKEDLMESLEKYKESCKSANPDDSLFTPPANVNFQDFSQMMQGLPTGTPSSDNSQMPSQDQIEQMMQQYQGQ